MPIGLSFETPPLDAIEHHKAKNPELHFDYDEIMHEAHHKAFTVAKVVNLDLLGDIQESLHNAKSEGKSFEHWKKDLTPTLKSYGWYGKTEVVNPLTGEIKNIDVNSRRLKVIFETNMRTANAVGRYKSQMLSDAEYLRYSALMDARTRPTHSSKNGIILPKTDPWWDKNYPPNGWNCRCKAQAITSSQIEHKGLKITSSAPADIADKDWSYHVGKTDNTINLYKEKIDALKCKETNAREKTVNCGFIEIAKEALSTHEKIALNHVAKIQLNEMINEVIIKKNQAYPINYIQIGVISEVVTSHISSLLNIETQSFGVILHKNDLQHARPERKEKYNQAFSLEEMQQLVDVIAEGKEVFVDTREKHKNIIFIFKDIHNKDMINKIIVNINQTVKKFKKTNAIVTLAKIKKAVFDADLKGGELYKIEQ